MKSTQASIGTLIACTFALAGCASSDNERPAGQPAPAPSTTGSISVENPKNATAGEVCDLLPPVAAEQLGVVPEGEVLEKELTDSGPENCVWQGATDDTFSVAFAAFDDRTLQEYYDTKDQYQTYEELEIGGHPAVIAMQDDPVATATCDLWVASNPEQVVKAQTALNTQEMGSGDPCAVAKKQVELSMPSWPAA